MHAILFTHSICCCPSSCSCCCCCCCCCCCTTWTMSLFTFTLILPFLLSAEFPAFLFFARSLHFILFFLLLFLLFFLVLQPPRVLNNYERCNNACNTTTRGARENSCSTDGVNFTNAKSTVHTLYIILYLLNL